MQVYAIGDIHGHLDLLQAVHDLIARDRAANACMDAPIIHIGDLVDRGPDSPGVLRYLRDGIARGENWQVLMGNHDRLLLNFIRMPEWHDPGLRSGLDYLHPAIGGRATLQSYGVTALHDVDMARAEAAALVPQADLDFIASRPRMIDMGAQLFVHAGCGPVFRWTSNPNTTFCGFAIPSCWTGVTTAHLWCMVTPPCRAPVITATG